jgi:hypothetical protein
MTAQENLRLVCKIKDISYAKNSGKTTTCRFRRKKKDKIQHLFFRNETTFEGLPLPY